MGTHRHHTWTDIAEPDEHVTVFLKLDEALEGFLGDFASSSLKAYTIRAEGGSSVGRSRAQVRDAVDSLSGSPNWLLASYIKPIQGQEPSNNVSFFTQPIAVFTQPLGIKDRISCCLTVSGKEENETKRLFDSWRKQLDAEIKRHWPKSNAAGQEIAPPAATRRR